MKPVKNVSTTLVLAANNDAPRAGQLIGDRYRLEQPLERGAMGSVWRAEQVRLRAPVAVKFLDPALIGDKEMHDRFVQEARSAAAVRSAHVVQVFDYGSDGGLPYIAMELLDGENLSTRLGRGNLTPEELDKIFGEIARGIGKAHSMGVIHRDLKPGNIFIAREGDHEVTKLVDFGIAKVKADALKCTQNVGTHVGTLLGTPQYMSPEQVRGSATVDHRTDLWALGIIACECLTGRYPFSGTTIGDLTVQICTEKPSAPSSLGEVPPGFDQWFFKATAKKPNKRFTRVEEMASALHEILELASASQTSPWPRRILNLPSRSEVRLAYSAVATWPGHAFVKARAVWLMAVELLLRLGREVSQLGASAARRARALIRSDELSARPLLSRPGPGLVMAVIVLLSGITLVALSGRAPESVAASPKPVAASTEPVAASTEPVAASTEPTLAAAGEVSVPSAPADIPNVEASEARQEPAFPAVPEPSATPTPARTRNRPSAEAQPARDTGAPATKPITLAMAKAAAKIMDTPEPGATRASSERAAAKASPKAQETRPRATPAPARRSSSPKSSGEHPFDDRL